MVNRLYAFFVSFVSFVVKIVNHRVNLSGSCVFELAALRIDNNSYI